MTKPTPENVPKALDTIADVVLAYKPKPKSEVAKKRKKLSRKIAAFVKRESEAAKEK